MNITPCVGQYYFKSQFGPYGDRNKSSTSVILGRKTNYIVQEGRILPLNQRSYTPGPSAYQEVKIDKIYNPQIQLINKFYYDQEEQNQNEYIDRNYLEYIFDQMNKKD